MMEFESCKSGSTVSTSWPRTRQTTSRAGTWPTGGHLDLSARLCLARRPL